MLCTAEASSTTGALRYTDSLVVLDSSASCRMEAIKPMLDPLLRREWGASIRAIYRNARLDVAPLSFRGSTSIDTAATLGAPAVWSYGSHGEGIRVAIFDTGLASEAPGFGDAVEEITNWTSDETTSDAIGHGTFVAGLVASREPRCPGFAPAASLLIFRVFTSNQMSYTAWFLDAFNYALQAGVDVLNLSIGGPDFSDAPFMDKVNELSANSVIVVSAIGNDGPLYGTLNNPGDQLDVIGVGGVDGMERLAKFSSRGMTTWELPGGYGRVKPDVVAYATAVRGLAADGSCRTLSGTSVASPVVAGAVALLASTVPAEKRAAIINPASMKQALTESARRLDEANVFEQGAGLLNLQGAAAILASYTPRASAFPPIVDLTDCPYMWPYCVTPLYATAQPVIVNVTLLNGMGVHGELLDEPVWETSNCAGVLDVTFTHSAVLWPWTGYVALHIRVSEESSDVSRECEGSVTVTIVSLETGGSVRTTELVIPVTARVMPTPKRAQRLLWDQFHSLRYPPGYFPRDSMALGADVLDWNGDHIHTNFRSLFEALINAGYVVEVLGAPLTCFDPKLYGALLLVDPEEEYYAAEVDALTSAVRDDGLAVVVVAEWFNGALADDLKFFDEATRQEWEPVTGGANVPALNELLAPFGVALSDAVVSGVLSLPAGQVVLDASSGIARFPAGGRLVGGKFRTEVPGASGSVFANVLGVAGAGTGSVAVFADSSCLDDAAATQECFWLLLRVLEHVARGADLDVAALGLGTPLRRVYVASGVSEPTRFSAALGYYSGVVDEQHGAGSQARGCEGAAQSHAHRHTISDKLAAGEYYSDGERMRFRGQPNVRLGPRPMPVGPTAGEWREGVFSWLSSLPAKIIGSLFSKIKAFVTQGGLWMVLLIIGLLLWLARLIMHRVLDSEAYSLNSKDFV
ncbi:uncharacterized protein AMSG_00669 [Thecamonas trahens ATCC 50062]|uniref:Uncharacterized protein n=1 Tax=Thecamonas trahens ATCC 50062 TaxID=461836 RepID=A0A0L0DGQ0_THETB|nr:hypothetical protein AMSG_00669 [Thecamonas trahens ATCC 50062]KNC50508.1 hypothetical protein AMSG_00669 [Thecamonas trahens ATCC 50062]|eukprot:XP_013762400.1 hypothetical protein AMSG_00669 [Thecamonas trahens ATCC 50062]